MWPACTGIKYLAFMQPNYLVLDTSGNDFLAQSQEQYLSITKEGPKFKSIRQKMYYLLLIWKSTTGYCKPEDKDDESLMYFWPKTDMQHCFLKIQKEQLHASLFNNVWNN